MPPTKDVTSVAAGWRRQRQFVKNSPIVRNLPRPAVNLARNLRVVHTALELTVRLPRMRTPEGRRDTGEWLAERLTVLGPTYIKIGQFIASRGDVYGKEFAAGFSGMHSGIVEVSRGDEARALLGASVEMARFRRIDDEPVSAASIAQVHRGVLLDGRRVAIKVMRTDVRADIAGDMAFLSGLTGAAEWVSMRLGAADDVKTFVLKAKETVQDLSGYLTEELDLVAEAQNIDAFCRMYPEDHPEVRVPRLVPDACGTDAIVMEELPSRNVLEVAALSKPEDRQASARMIMRVFLRQLLTNGVVHGDPHVGNMGIHADGRLVLYDFGSIVRIDRDDVCHLKELVAALLVGDSNLAVSALRRIGAEVKDEAALEAYVLDYREYMRTLDFSAMVASARVRMDTTLPQPASGVRDQGQQQQQQQSAPGIAVPAVMPSRIGRIVRSFALLEGICKTVDSGFNYFDAIADGGVASPLAEIVLDQDFVAYKLRYDPRVLERRAIRAITEVFRIPMSK